MAADQHRARQPALRHIEEFEDAQAERCVALQAAPTSSARLRCSIGGRSASRNDKDRGGSESGCLFRVSARGPSTVVQRARWFQLVLQWLHEGKHCGDDLLERGAGVNLVSRCTPQQRLDCLYLAQHTGDFVGLFAIPIGGPYTEAFNKDVDGRTQQQTWSNLGEEAVPCSPRIPAGNGTLVSSVDKRSWMRSSRQTRSRPASTGGPKTSASLVGSAHLENSSLSASTPLYPRAASASDEHQLAGSRQPGQEVALHNDFPSASHSTITEATAVSQLTRLIIHSKLIPTGTSLLVPRDSSSCYLTRADPQELPDTEPA